MGYILNEVLTTRKDNVILDKMEQEVIKRLEKLGSERHWEVQHQLANLQNNT